MINWTNNWTIMRKLSALIMFSLAVAVGFFLITFNISNNIIDKKSSRQPVDGKIVMSLRKYILENDVRSDDSKALTRWCRNNKRVDIEVFVNEKLVFSSIKEMSGNNTEVEETNTDKSKAYPYKFSDAKADVVFYQYLSLYDQAKAVEMAVALLIFFGIIFAGIRYEVRYIRTINEEIHVLEGGDLSREITVRGNDEVSMLAESVDEFRKAMKNQLSTIENLEKSNRLMSAEIAHDLRTPLTSLIMYLDFAQAEISNNEEQAEEYLNRARDKAVRLKNLLEENFNYVTMPDFFLIEKQSVQAYEVLSGYTGDIMTYLESEGFHVRSDVSFGHSNILIQRDAVGRVFSNLLTNIMKYADRDEEIYICCREKEHHVEVRLENRIKVFEGDKPESTGFGARIVKRLMAEMDGEYSSEETDGKYITTLRFLKA